MRKRIYKVYITDNTFTFYRTFATVNWTYNVTLSSYLRFYKTLYGNTKYGYGTQVLRLDT